MFRSTPGFFKPNTAMIRLARPAGLLSTKITKSTNRLFHASSHKRNNQNTSLAQYGEKLKKLSLKINPTQKEHLKKIQDNFGTLEFSFDPQVEDMRKTRFIFSNDYELSDYMPALRQCFSKETAIDTTYHLGDVLRSRKPKSKVGLVVGNGAILSLLPEIPAPDVLLLDIEPAVHLFILEIKRLILEHRDESDFPSVKQRLIEKINSLAEFIKPSKKSVLDAEMEGLGDLHFLASEKRLKICGDALLNKDLIPINTVNVFSEEAMDNLKLLLLKLNCEISFMNLTNLADYDKGEMLYSTVSKMPFAENFKILMTTHFSDGASSNAFHLTNLKDLKQTLSTISMNFCKIDIFHEAMTMMANKGPGL